MMKNKLASKYSQQLLLIGVANIVSSGLVMGAPGPGDVQGLTALQSDTANAIFETCVQLPAASSLQGDIQDLKVQCNAMVGTGFALLGSQQGGPLGLTREEYAGANQNIATEELGTVSRVATSTLSGQMAAVGTHLLTLHNLGLGGGASADDQSGLLNDRISVFTNAIGGFGDLSASDREDAADFNAGGFMLGVDYRITDNFVAGIAGGYTHMNSDYKTNINVSGGSLDGDFGNLSMFASYDINNFYVDGIFAYGWSSYDIKRSVFIQNTTGSAAGTASGARTASSSPDGRQISFALNGGYNFHHKALNVRPYIGMNYYNGQIDGYSESGAQGLNLSVDEQKFDSLQTTLGTQISYAFSQSFGVIIPSIDFSWHHEFENDQRIYTAQYAVDPANVKQGILTNTPDRDFFLLGGGVSTVLQGGTQLFINYQTVLGYRRVTSHGFSTGVRIEF